MFANLFLLAAAQFSIALGHPKVIAQPRAPIETAGPLWAGACDGSTDWNKPAPPVRIHGNTYLVGTCGISSILIVGTAGDVLIDSGTEQGADLVVANIRRLGFDPHDVRILLHSHEHFDHVGGMARLQQLTGAQLYASQAASPVLKSGVASFDDPQSGLLDRFPPARVDRTVHDGEEIRLGNLMLKAVATPGHTAGAMSWHWVSCNGGVCRSIVYADSLSPVSRDDYRFSDHPDYLKAYRTSIAKIAALDCDILLTPHPSASDMVERFASKSLENREGCRDYAAKLTKQLDERLAKEEKPK